MKLKSQSLVAGKAIDPKYAFGKMCPENGIALSTNVSPHLAWEDVPAGTRSFAVLCIDADVPSKPDDVNKTDREVPADLPRVDFSHWVVFDLPADVREIAEGAHSNGITAGGKAADAVPGCRLGVNDYTAWFAGDEQMKGDYFGYDGPCPPFNDSLVHHYTFTVYALDVDKLDLPAKPDARAVLAAIEGHVLAKDSLTAVYSLNPRVAKEL